MDNLPTPFQQSQQAMPISPTPQLAAPSVAPTGTPATTDPKELLARATTEVEQIIAATPLNPTERAERIHAVKAAYIKTRFNLEITPPSAQ